MSVLKRLIHPQPRAQNIILLVSASISFVNVLYFSVRKSFTSVVKFIPRHFINFGTVLNILFLNFSDSLLFVQRKITNFYILYILQVY